MNKTIILFFIINFSISQSSEKIEHSKNPSQNNIFQKLDEIASSDAFKELQKQHAYFKNKKEELGKKLEEKKAALQKEQEKLEEKLEQAEVEFSQELENLRKDFDQIKNNIKTIFRNNGLYSILEGQKLIEALRELQEKEEFPLKKEYLLTKETYNRKKFEEERKKIERRHEAIREFIRTFTQEPTTPEEKQLLNQLKESLANYKNNWYKTKEILLPTGEHSFENEKAFQLAEEELKLKQKEKFKNILNQLEMREREHEMQKLMEEIQEIDTKKIQTSQAAVFSENQSNNQQNQALAKALPKLRPSKL